MRSPDTSSPVGCCCAGAAVAARPRVIGVADEEPRVAVLIPCYNEALTVGRVIDDFRKALPGCVVYVYDNRSTDGTGDVARASGAVVRREPRLGKGGVVRRMFAEIDAGIYGLTDVYSAYYPLPVPEQVA